MSIPVLNELSDELTRIYVAGARLAKGDPRLKKYIAPLDTLGQKAPVFAALSKKLAELVDGEEKSSPENLMELGTLLHSVLYTQGATTSGTALADVEYGEEPLKVAQMPYSQLHELIDLLTSGSQQHTPIIDEAYKCGTYNDPRLYEAYIESVTENKSYLSNYVCETILPAIGQDIAPFIERALNIDGQRRDARLFKALYRIKGKEVLPLSEKILQDGSRTLLVEALYTLGEDAKYEQTLLSYAKDRKSEVRQAAFAALTKLGSPQGDEMLTEGLEKANIGHLFEALCETRSQAVLEKAYEIVRECAKAPKEHKGKLSILLQVLAHRDDEDGLALLESLLGNLAFYENYVSLLDLHEAVQILFRADTPRKNDLLLKISDGNTALDVYRIQVCVRLFSPEEVYDKCRKLAYDSYSTYSALLSAYGVAYGEARDMNAPKPWDKRWAKAFLDKGQVMHCYELIYNDDARTWEKLLDACIGQLKGKKNSYYRSYYGGILARAFELGHPFAKKYYDKFIKAGYPKESLDELVTVEE